MGRGAIDQAFDFADGVVDAIEPMFGRRDGGAAPTARTHALPDAKRALPSGWRVTIVKATERGAPDTYFVTNGSDYAACSTKELADRIHMLLGGGT